MNIFKYFADSYKIVLILVHHTRKQGAEDSMQRISGTNGLMGGADGAMILEKPDRSQLEATLTMTSRDFEDARILLHQNSDTMCWEFVGFGDGTPEDPTDPILAAVADFVCEQGAWKGSAKNLVEELQKKDPKLKVWPNTLSRKLNANKQLLQESFGVELVQTRTTQGKYMELQMMNDMHDMTDS